MGRSSASARSASSDGTTPKATAGRLSLYLRQLELLWTDGRETVSSSQLGESLGITDAQVRKDLAYFGQFGYPGIGYRVAELRDSLKSVLGTDRPWQTALIGIGNLGRALLGYGGFRERGFVLAALFDQDAALVGKKLHGMTVQSLDELESMVAKRNLELVILAVPAQAAQQVAERAERAGITGILNFAPTEVKVGQGVKIVSVDLGLQLEQLAFQVRHGADSGG